MHLNGQTIFLAKTNETEFIVDWREYQYSLTDKLKEAKGSAQLELLSQGWIKPNWWDRYLLNIKDELVFQREIIMKHDGISYWYARSIIPQKCYNLNPNFFKRLENESIRNLIFDNNIVHRKSMINYPIDIECIEFNWIKKHRNTIDRTLWVRLSEFSLEHLESFYLAEILFPELENI